MNDADCQRLSHSPIFSRMLISQPTAGQGAAHEFKQSSVGIQMTTESATADPWPAVVALLVEPSLWGEIAGSLTCCGQVHRCADDESDDDLPLDAEPTAVGPKAGSKTADMLAALRQGPADARELAALTRTTAGAVHAHLKTQIRAGLVGFDDARPRRFFLVAA